MKAIVGRVLAKETNAGVANLVVAAFDQDRSSLDHLGHRIGSVLTNSDGDFAIETEHCEPAGGSSRPDLVLAVFAPEDALGVYEPAPLPPERRLLHISSIPRFHSGAVEAFVIRLLQSQLDEFCIPSGKLARNRAENELEVAHSLSSLERAWENRERAAEHLNARLSRQADMELESRKLAKQKVAELSAVPQALRTHPHFVKEGTSPAKAHAHAIETGLNQLAAYSSSLDLRLDPAELEALGLRQTATGIEGEVDARKLMDYVAARILGTDLIRRRSLLEANASPKVADAGDQPDLENLLRRADEPPPSASDVQLEQQILARVLGQLDDLPAAGENLPSRPNAADVQKVIDALELRGGVADATAFHDFHVLQVAFKHVWTQAFDASLRDRAEELYHEYTRAYEEAGLKVPPEGSSQHRLAVVPPEGLLCHL